MTDDNDPGATQPDSEASGEEHCAQCGQTIETSSWYPIATARDADGMLAIRPFCSEDCKETWLDGRPR